MVAFAFAASVADGFEQRKMVVGQNMVKHALMMEIYFCSDCVKENEGRDATNRRRRSDSIPIGDFFSIL